MTDANKFKPAWWLRNGHLQSCFSSINRFRVKVPFEMQQLDLPDGDFIELALAGPADRPCVLLLPGLEGSISSPYIQMISKAIMAMGWQVVVMHYRGCGQRINRFPKAYNCFDYADLSCVMTRLVNKHKNQPIYAVGFSMGGNILLHYLRYHDKPNIQAALTVSTPYNISQSVNELADFYHKFLVRTMKKKVEQKIKLGMELPVNLQQLKQVNTIYDFDELVSAPLYGFPSAIDYYDAGSCHPFLAEIKTPTLMIFAEDDPFIPKKSIPIVSELSSKVELAPYLHGGHVGFIEGMIPGVPRYWLPDKVVQYFLNINRRGNKAL